MSGTVVEEDIVTDTKWDKAHSPYIIITSITVHENATLEIEPGVEVVFANAITITVKGKLMPGGVLRLRSSRDAMKNCSTPRGPVYQGGSMK